jgi:cell fate regulator YaaT (PSP1 superfamily)
LKNGMDVICDTGRGVEFGTVKGSIREISEKEFSKSLKKILRIADDKDRARYQSNIEKKGEAIKTCKEMVLKHKLEMKLIDADFTFDETKVVFYFTSENRVDFRALVKDLAGVFHKRIELLQVGVRDEAKMLGGCGNCGRQLCCSGFLQDFDPVSIKMAKVQNLSLNPAKISGCCGRLMCCLKYENDIYQEMRKGMPNHGEIIDTDDGKAVVMESNILLSLVKARLIEEERTEDSHEKLSSDIHTYKKGEFVRNKKPGGGGGGGKRNK